MDKSSRPPNPSPQGERNNKEGRNIVVTGMPRSGTTLFTAMLDDLPDCVCLNEPLWQFDWLPAHPHASAAAYVEWLIGDFADIRRRLLCGEPVPDRRAPDGSKLTNYFRRDEQQRRVHKTFEIQPVTRPALSTGFTLGVKHTGPYLAVLEELAASGAFEPIALLRHPMEVLWSWRTLNIPVSRGEMPGAMFYWPQMRTLVGASMDLLEKQVRMYGLVHQRLMQLYNDNRIKLVRYDELAQAENLFPYKLGIKGEVHNRFVVQDKKIPPIECSIIEQALQRFAPEVAKAYQL